MAPTRSIILIGLVALAGPWVYDKYTGFGQMFLKNTPAKLPSMNAFSSYKVLFQDTIRNCEDAVIDEDAGMALLSCDPGRDWWNTVMGTFISSHKEGEIWSYLYSQIDVEDEALLHPLGRHGFPADREFHPLGLEYEPASDTVFAVNHASSGSGIEIFKLSPTREHLLWERTFIHPKVHTPNSIAAINEHELFVTNDHYFLARNFKPFSKIETYLGLPLGEVLYVNLKTNEVRTLARLGFANGVKMLNKTTLAAASTSGPDVYIYSIDPETKSLTQKLKIRVPFAPDNISVDSNGKLLIAGHPYPPTMEVVSSTNHEYDLDNANDGRKPASERPRAAGWIKEWDGNPEGKTRDLYIGAEYGTTCTAVRDVKRKMGIITGLYEKGILVWKE
ncbi:putative paraoxonase [Rhizodiscina lignyota]|uniref:Paraoxonase n=1 Tax=Rhizodiscina lignyota TaxID=1504668 RepID=A0A9P4IEV4_9PEZI|nr:putative paraoxonase [Rhizodiscina lignyota]